MRVAGTAVLIAPPARILAVLRDPRRFVAALPNVDELDFEPGEDGSFRAKIRPALALGEVPIETVWRPCALSPEAPGPQAPGPEGLAYAMEGGTGEHRVELEATVTLRERERERERERDGGRAGDAGRAGDGEGSGRGDGEGSGRSEGAGPVASEAEWTVSFEVTGTMRSAGQRTIAAIVAAQAEAALQAAARAATIPTP